MVVSTEVGEGFVIYSQVPKRITRSRCFQICGGMFSSDRENKKRGEGYSGTLRNGLMR
ncbi:MAG: hypothetical protein IPI37_02695 [Bacteroidales bacterium]|nr:hypothetical protein [Bacteroidales bacterium]